MKCFLLFLFAIIQCLFYIHANDEYDFIVIGAGTAGSIVASRLSQIECFKVVLLEAGGEPPLISQIPSLQPLMLNTNVDWNYTSVPQSNLSVKDGMVNLHAGKMLGGSGNINLMVFLRGNRLNYENWQANGAVNWGWKNVLKYFKKIECDHEVRVKKQHHGFKGPICITNPGYENELVKSFFSSLSSKGYNYKDPNGDGTQIGFSTTPVNVCNNVRQSTYRNYLKPVMQRSNLNVINHAFVKKIVINENKRAIGVIYSKNGVDKFIKATKEVIVSAGAIRSPQLLMISGIGPEKHLRSHNIPVIKNLQVGENFQDHLANSVYFTKPYEDIFNNDTLQQFFEGKGPLTFFGFANAFIELESLKNKSYPDIQLVLRYYPYPAEKGERINFVLVAIQTSPRSRGNVRLSSKDAHQYPLIDPRYLSDERDLQNFASGTKFINELLKSMNVEKLGYRIEIPELPNCKIYDNTTDKYWQCVSQTTAFSTYHYSGTCKMGSKRDATSVVDTKLRVIGIKQLRVIDASVMPSLTAGNIQAAVMMIAERGSDFILKRYSNEIRLC